MAGTYRVIVTPVKNGKLGETSEFRTNDFSEHTERADNAIVAVWRGKKLLFVQ